MRGRPASPQVNGAKLREVRQAVGLTVSEAAIRMGISVSYLSALERGQRPTAKPDTFNRIATVLGVPREDLLLPVAKDAA
jgi:transcriptional regulator with XRE-family HTH domain